MINPSPMNKQAKKTIVSIGALAVGVLIVFLFAADIISLTGLQGNILNTRSSVFESRMPSGTIAATVYIPTEITLIDQSDFIVPITLEPHRTLPSAIQATITYGPGIVPEHYYSSFLEDKGSTLIKNDQVVTANIVNTPSIQEPLLRLRGILQEEMETIDIELSFEKDNQKTSSIKTEVEIKKELSTNE